MNDSIPALEQRTLGRSGVPVSALTLGAMNFGNATERSESIRIIHAALDAGITVVDTADAYDQGLNEEIVGEALQGRRDEVFLATKFHGRTGDGPFNGC
ncbi:MAG: aldo/keto reductase, partial [Microbacteriaceae bacterium]